MVFIAAAIISVAFLSRPLVDGPLYYLLINDGLDSSSP